MEEVERSRKVNGDVYRLSLTFQNCIRRVIRRPFFLRFSDSSMGAFSSWLSLLRSEWAPTRREKLTRLERFDELGRLLLL